MREAPRQRLDRVDGVARPQTLLDIADADERMTGGGGTGTGKPDRECARLRLEWIARRDQPPNIIQLQKLLGDFADIEMTVMGGIETAAQQPDTESVAGRSGRGDPVRLVFQRSCPVTAAP